MIGGEAWTRQVLAELRAARFTPAAWVRFLGRSFARSRERRADRQDEHRTVVVLAAAGAAGWLLTLQVGGTLLALAGAGWWLLLAVMLDWHLGMLERPGGGRVDGVGAANLLTLARGGLAPALLALAGSAAGLTLLLLAGSVDVADGRVARRRGEVTILGTWLDGAVDTLVVGAAALGAALHGLLPAWAASLVLARFALPWGLAAGLYFGRAERPSLDGITAARPASLVAGAAVYAGLVLAFLHLGGAGPVTAIGAAAGIGALGAAVRADGRLARV